jgi:hypothetical protein
MVVASFVGTTGIIGVITGVTDGVGFTGLPFVTVGFTFGGAAVTIGNCARHSPAPPPLLIHSANVVAFFFATGATVGVTGGGLHVAPPNNPDDPFAHWVRQFGKHFCPAAIVGVTVTLGVFTVVCVPDATGDGVGVGVDLQLVPNHPHQQNDGSDVGTSDACIGVPFMGTH